MREVPPVPTIRRTVVLALTILLVTVASPPARGDSVYLLTGELFTGKVLRFNDKEVSIELSSGGIITFKTSQVRRLRRWLPGKDLPEVIDFEKLNGADENGNPVGRPSGDVRDTIPVVSVKDWYLEPPPGFELQEPEKNSEALRVWVDPIVQAKVVLTAHSIHTTRAEQLKATTHAELTSSPETRVIRDQAVERGGDGGYSGWILELEHSFTGRPVRQIQLFLESNKKTFVLSFTCPIDDYPSLARFFEDSLTSFRVFKTTGNEPPAPKTPGGEPPPEVELPPVDELPELRIEGLPVIEDQ